MKTILISHSLTTTINHHILTLPFKILVLSSIFCAYPWASGQTLDVSELNSALKEGLTKGRDAGKEITCTSIGVFLDQAFVKFLIGGVILATIIAAGWGWYTQAKNGTPPSRIFWILVFAMALISISGVLFSTFMGCSA